MSERRAARWIMPLSASVALHAAFFCFFCLISSAAPGAPSAVTHGVTVVLRRVEGSFSAPAAPSAEKAAGSEKVVPKAAAVPKKDAPPIPAKTDRKTKADAKKSERPSAAQPAAKTAAASENTALTNVPAASSAVQSGVSGNGGRGASSPAGGGLAAADAGRIFELSDLKVSRRVKPDYPAIARKRKEEGTVTLLITLEGANVLSVKVEKSSGFSALDEAAAAAVRRWSFEPDKNAGGARAGEARPRRIQARVPVTFRLKL